jgi:hypothetical protein
MKKLAIILATIGVLFGCQKGNIEPGKEKDTTYSLTIEEGLFDQIRRMAIDEGYKDIEVDLIFSEYYNGQRVKINTAMDANDAYRYNYTASERTEYITVRVDINFIGQNYKEDSKVTIYIANVFYLDKGENTLIEFRSDTFTSSKEPK